MRPVRALLLASWNGLRAPSVGLGFADPSQERRYQHNREAWLQERQQYIVALFICLMLGFIPLDPYFAPGYADRLNIVRMVATVSLAGIAVTARMISISSTFLMCLVATTVHVAVILMNATVGLDSNYNFTAGVMLVQTGVWFLLGLPFVVAVTVNGIALVVFLTLNWAVFHANPHDVLQIAVYLCALSAVGGVASHIVERLFRRNFANMEILKNQSLEYRTRAMRDGLTGLWNRPAMEEQVADACRRTGDTGLGGAVFMIDLDRFKPVNDRYGHQAGDEVLIAIARRVQSVLRPSDSVGRIGGDEFLVLVEDLPDADFARQLAGRIRAEIESPIRVRVHDDNIPAEVTVGASIGMAGYSGAIVAPGKIINSADLDMYRDKARRNEGAADPR